MKVLSHGSVLWAYPFPNTYFLKRFMGIYFFSNTKKLGYRTRHTTGILRRIAVVILAKLLVELFIRIAMTKLKEKIFQK